MTSDNGAVGLLHPGELGASVGAVLQALGTPVLWSSPGRSRLRTVPLAYPFGRGVNFQIEVSHVDRVLEQATTLGHAPLIPMEERWYKTAHGMVGNRQFVVADPDGCLLRFFQDLGAPQD